MCPRGQLPKCQFGAFALTQAEAPAALPENSVVGARSVWVTTLESRTLREKVTTMVSVRVEKQRVQGGGITKVTVQVPHWKAVMDSCRPLRLWRRRGQNLQGPLIYLELPLDGHLALAAAFRNRLMKLCQLAHEELASSLLRPNQHQRTTAGPSRPPVARHGADMLADIAPEAPQPAEDGPLAARLGADF